MNENIKDRPKPLPIVQSYIHKRILEMQTAQWEPAKIAEALGLPLSTVEAILKNS